MTSLKEEAIRKITNFISRDRADLAKNKQGKQDIDIINSLANEWYENYRYELTPGKELLGKVKKYAQEELQNDPNRILEISDAIACPDFKILLEI